jgi:hypothetical protein
MEYVQSHISEDGDKIYLIFAKYSKQYLDFIKGRRQTTQDFLEMQQYGPWSIREADDMRYLAEIIVAFIIRAKDGF